MVRIHALGGYGIVGRNMTVYEFTDTAIAVDIGIHLDNYIEYTEAEPNRQYVDRELLQQLGAVPDIRQLTRVREKIRAILITHGHLDHVGAVPFLEREFKADIITTPFTAEILRTLAKDARIRLKNPIREIPPGGIVQIDRLRIRFIPAPHSIPETMLILIESPEGVFLHATDFKLDQKPGIGKPLDFKPLEKYAGAYEAVILDVLNAEDETRTPSESIAQAMLEDTLLQKDLRKKGIIVTTFSSHMSRLQEIVRVARKLKRNVVFIGRSLDKYTRAAMTTGITQFTDVEIIGMSRKARAFLKKIHTKREEYLIVMTGHQGEPGSVLERVARRDIPYPLGKDDVVVFSCRTIPTEKNKRNREVLEELLSRQGVRIYKDVHVSGHLSGEDHLTFISRLKPKRIIPTHSGLSTAKSFQQLMRKLDYAPEHVPLLIEGDVYTLPSS